MRPYIRLCLKNINDTMMEGKEICYIVVAAGSGSRFGADRPKQYCLLGGRPVLMWTVENLLKATPGADVILVLHSDFIDYWKELCQEYAFDIPHRIATGGATRTESVAHALHEVKPDARVVMIHDGARPVVTGEMIGGILDALTESPAAVPVIPVTDSLRSISADGSSAPVDRSGYVAVQTPQAFRAEEILRLLPAYDEGKSYTDDATLFQNESGKPLTLVKGNPHNIKITNPGDLEVAAIFLAQV